MAFLPECFDFIGEDIKQTFSLSEKLDERGEKVQGEES